MKTTTPTENKRQVAVRLSVEIDDRLAALAKKTGRSKTFYIREALERQIEDMEDAFSADLVMQRVLDGTEKLYTQEEAREYLGLAPRIHKRGTKTVKKAR